MRKMRGKKATAVVSLAALAICGAALGQASKRAPAKAAPASAAKPAIGLEKRLADYAALYLPYDPGSKISVEKSNLVLPGFTAWRVQRAGRYEALKADATVFVSNDRKWFYEGDSFRNSEPRPVRTAADLGWAAS